MTKHVSYCRNCPSACGVTLDVEDGRVLSIAGDRDNALSSGYLCIKGLAGIEWHNGEDRLTEPLKRAPDGHAEPVGVTAALDEVHARLAAIIDRHGPDSVALYYGTGANANALGHAAMKGYMSVIGSPYIYSSMTIDQSAKWVVMGRMGAYLGGKYSVIDADVAMIVGANPTVSHTTYGLPLSNPGKWLREQRARGMKLIVVDPRRSETARQADLHLAVRPGEDATLFAGLIHIVLAAGLEDRAFLDDFATSLDALRASVAPFTPAYVARRTGVPEEDLHTAATWLATARRPLLTSGTGASMATDSNIAEHLIEAFNAVCGGYRRAGDLVRNIGGINPLPMAEGILPPWRSWEHGPKCHSTDIGPLLGEYPSALLPREIHRDGKRIRALIVVGGNPAKALGQPEETIPALRALDLLVTLDPRPTETGELAHFQFPTTLHYERDDCNALIDFIHWTTHAQIARAALPPPPGVIDDWVFFWELCARMGKALPLKRPHIGGSHDQLPGDVLELAPGKRPETDHILRWMTAAGAVDYDRLAASPHGVTLDDVEVRLQSAPPGADARLDLCPGDVANEIAAVWQREEEQSGFPYRLISRRMLETMNSAYRNSSRISRRFPRNPVFMNPEDMTQEGIERGSKVEIASQTGRIVAYAERDAGLPRGVVSIAHMWGAIDPAEDPAGERGAFTGRLVSLTSHLQPINYMPRQSAIPVSCRPHVQSA